MNDIEYQDFERIIKYAMIYGFANERSDVLQQCGVFHRKNEKRAPDDRVPLDGDDREAFDSLCLYAVASAGSADDAVSSQICRITCEHSGLLSQDNRASVMAVADMLKDKRKGKECPFYLLHEYLKKEEAGVQACRAE